MKSLDTARTTGLLYLGLAIAGFVGFLFARGELFVEADATATLANLVERPGLARLGIVADLTVVLTQALAAIWFYKLFRFDGPVAAGSIAAFGLMNAAAVLVATAASVTALAVAGGAPVATGGGADATVQTLYVLGNAMWDVGGLFFGLWLIPMGHLVLTSRVMPRALGWVLMSGGIGYVLSTYVLQLAPATPAAVEALLVGLATIGEFWMVGYLIIVGKRSSPGEAGP